MAPDSGSQNPDAEGSALRSALSGLLSVRSDADLQTSARQLATLLAETLNANISIQMHGKDGGDLEELANASATHGSPSYASQYSLRVNDEPWGTLLIEPVEQIHEREQIVGSVAARMLELMLARWASESQRLRAEQRIGLLEGMSDLLASGQGLEETRAALATLAVPDFADGAIFDPVSTGDRRVGDVDGTEPEEALWALLLRESTGLSDAQGWIADREPLLLPDVASEPFRDIFREEPRIGEAFADQPPGSVIVVPVAHPHTPGGVLTLVRAVTSEPFSEEDLELAKLVGERASVALQVAELWDAQERTNEHLRILSGVGQALASLTDRQTALENLAGVLVARLGDLCLIDTLDAEGNINRDVSRHWDPAVQPLADELKDRFPPSRYGRHPVARVIRGAGPIVGDFSDENFLRQTTRDDDHYGVVSRMGFESYMCVPLTARGKILGTITMVSTEPSRHFDETDLALLTEVGQRAGLRVDSVRLFEERDTIARILQEGLLPVQLPDVQGFEFASMYRAGGDGMQVGGDFYDVFERDENSFGVVIGDVCGKGPEAAAVMGLARQTVRVAGMNESRPSRILNQVNDVLLTDAFDRYLTACDVRITRHGREATLTVCCAGHPKPYLVDPDGTCREIGDTGDLLGIWDDIEISDVPAKMVPGSLLVLYTDGVIDDRSREGREGLEQVLSSIAGRGCAAAMKEIERWWESRDQAVADDAAVLVVGCTL